MLQEYLAQTLTDRLDRALLAGNRTQSGRVLIDRALGCKRKGCTFSQCIGAIVVLQLTGSEWLGRVWLAVYQADN